MKRTCISFAMLVGIGSAAAAIAPDISPPAIDVLSPQLNAIEFGRQNAQTINDGSDGDPGFSVDERGASLSSGLIGKSSQTTTRAEPAMDTSYQYSRQRTQQNLRNFVARTKTEAGRADLEQALAAQPTLMDEIRAGIRAYGFAPHNVADAYAIWWMNVWLVANKRDEVPDSATVEAVKREVRNAFAATPEFAATTDAERQEYAEALLLQATMLGSMFEQWKNAPQMLDQLAEAARKGAEVSGLDLSKMTLTPGGFVPRKGADAGDAAGAGEDTVRNARSDGEGATSPLGLALAAGAGPGATLLGGFALMRRG